MHRFNSVRLRNIDTVSISGYTYRIKFKLLPKKHHDKTMISAYYNDQYVTSAG